MIYLSFKVKEKHLKESFIKGFIRNFIGLVLPRTNPDFEDKIKFVTCWILEFEDQYSIPLREIGLSDNEKTIIKLPNEKNLGYWTDNNLYYDDFCSSFTTEIVKKQYFEDKWNENKFK